MAGTRPETTRLNNLNRVNLQGTNERLGVFARPVDTFRQVTPKRNQLLEALNIVTPVVSNIADNQMAEKKDEYVKHHQAEANKEIPKLIAMDGKELDDYLMSKPDEYRKVAAPIVAQYKAQRVLADAEDHDADATGVTKYEYLQGRFNDEVAQYNSPEFLSAYNSTVVPKLSAQQELFEEEALVKLTDEQTQGMFTMLDPLVKIGATPEDVALMYESEITRMKSIGVQPGVVNDLFVDRAINELKNNGNETLFNATKAAGGNVKLYDNKKYRAKLEAAWGTHQKKLEAAVVKEPIDKHRIQYINAMKRDEILERRANNLISDQEAAMELFDTGVIADAGDGGVSSGEQAHELVADAARKGDANMVRPLVKQAVRERDWDNIVEALNSDNEYVAKNTEADIKLLPEASLDALTSGLSTAQSPQEVSYALQNFKDDYRGMKQFGLSFTESQKEMFSKDRLLDASEAEVLALADVVGQMTGGKVTGEIRAALVELTGDSAFVDDMVSLAKLKNDPSTQSITEGGQEIASTVLSSKVVSLKEKYRDGTRQSLSSAAAPMVNGSDQALLGKVTAIAEELNISTEDVAQDFNEFKDVYEYMKLGSLRDGAINRTDADVIRQALLETSASNIRTKDGLRIKTSYRNTSGETEKPDPSTLAYLNNREFQRALEKEIKGRGVNPNDYTLRFHKGSFLITDSFGRPIEGNSTISEMEIRQLKQSSRADGGIPAPGDRSGTLSRR